MNVVEPALLALVEEGVVNLPAEDHFYRQQVPCLNSSCLPVLPRNFGSLGQQHCSWQYCLPRWQQ
jgi:hypothetical protein